MEQQLQAEQQELGNYQFKRLLGEGGFGQVYEAWDPKLQRSIAIKRLKPRMLSSRPENLLDEARMAASLRHPAFVKIFSIDGDAETQSIIMEYVDGSTLRQLVQGQPLSEEKVLDIAAQIAAAMEEAHAAKLIHGDIKPANLMLEASGTVRIMDFGLARRMDPQATESVVIGEAQGTIAYLAPELLTGARQSEQSDVYALGVVMYEMLTGARPFAQLSGLALAAAHIQSSSDLWPFPPETTPAIAALVRSMTARDPRSRISSMREVRGLIVRSKGKSEPRLSVKARRYSARELISTPARRRTLSVACAVLLIIGGGRLMLPAGWFQSYSPFFSETAAMKAGFDAIRTNDRPGNIDLAILNYSDILKHNPNHAAAAAALSYAYVVRHADDNMDQTWLQRADASAQLALKLNDQLAMAYAVQGTVRLVQGRMDEATVLSDQATRLDPLNWYGFFLKTHLLTKTGKLDRAESAATDAIRNYPQDHVFEDLLGSVKMQQGNSVAAEQAFRRSIKIQPDAVAVYANLSYALQHQNRMDEALKALQDGLQIRPDGKLYTNLGTALFNRGDYVGAAQAFERSVGAGVSGNNKYLRWANLADTLRWIPGRDLEARKAYQQAIDLLSPMLKRAPSDTTMLSRMGLYAARLDNRAVAIDHTRRALESGHTDASVRFRAAMTFELAGDRIAALAEIRKARALGYPDHLISAEPDLMALRRDPAYHHPTTESK